MKLGLVIPCHRRFVLTRIGLEQKAWLASILEPDIDLRVYGVVDTDDDDEEENENAIEQTGGRIVHCDNTSLGKRWNQGYLAAATLGCDVVMPCGTDSWLHPYLFRRLPEGNEVLVNHRYSIVEPTGQRRVDMFIPTFVGLMFRTQLAAAYNYAPCKPDIAKGCDTSTITRLKFVGGEVQSIDDGVGEYVAFHSRKQISRVDRLARRYGGTWTEPGCALDALYDLYYPEELLDRVRDFYVAARAKATIAARPSARRRRAWGYAS